MILSFKNKVSEDIFNGKTTKATIKFCSGNIRKVAVRKLDQLDSVRFLEELRVPPGNRLEALSGRRKGEFSICINNQFRIYFKWIKTGPKDVEIIDYH